MGQLSLIKHPDDAPVAVARLNVREFADAHRGDTKVTSVIRRRRAAPWRAQPVVSDHQQRTAPLQLDAFLERDGADDEDRRTVEDLSAGAASEEAQPRRHLAEPRGSCVPSRGCSRDRIDSSFLSHLGNRMAPRPL